MKHPRSQAGFSLVEVVLALAVTAFCLVSLLGLLLVGNLNNAATYDQTMATSLTTEIVSDLCTTPVTFPGVGGTVGTSLRYKIPIPAAGPGSGSTVTLFLDNNGTLSGSINSDASPNQTPTPFYRATLTFTPPTAAGTRASTYVRVLITWPALADKSASAQPAKYLGAIDTVVGLNCN